MRVEATSLLAVFLAGSAAIFLGSCGAEDKSGACTGTMSGGYFRLEVANYLVDTGIDVRINGRFIGKVGKGKPVPQSTDIEGTVKRLGEFPVCDKMVIDARGSSGTYTQKFCSKPRYLSPECSGPPNNDFCWESLAFVPSLPCTTCLYVPVAEPQCPCPYEPPADALASWEAC